MISGFGTDRKTDVGSTQDVLILLVKFLFRAYRGRFAVAQVGAKGAHCCM